MTRTARAAAIAAAATLLLAACGGNSDPAAETTTAAEVDVEAGAEETTDESDAWPIVEDEEGNVVENPEDQPAETFPLRDEPFFVSTSTGATITMTMDAQPDSNEEIAWLEQYRQDGGGEPVTYILSEVDNRNGTDTVNMYATTLYDLDGKSYECGMAMDYADENWRPVWLYGSTDRDEYETAGGEPMERSAGEELDQRFNEHDVDDSVDAYEAGTIVSICPADLPDEVTAVEVMPGGVYIDPTYATPESYMGEDG